MSEEARLSVVRELLDRRGVVHTRVTVAGAARDIAVVHGARPEAVSELIERVREAGFRFLAVDLEELARDDA